MGYTYLGLSIPLGENNQGLGVPRMFGREINCTSEGQEEMGDLILSASPVSKLNASLIIRSLSIPLLIALLSLLPAFTSLAQEESHLLDGSSYIGKNGEKGQNLAEYEDEEIIFENGLFTSVSCEPYNFGSSPYTAKLVGDKIHFQAVTESPTHGKISWQGIVDGSRADVTFVWTKKRWYWDTRREYWFKGNLK